MPGTVADVFEQMNVLDNGLRLGAGQKDVARAITAVSMAQHYLETVAASWPRIFQTTVTIATIANQETSSWDTIDSTLLRIDKIWLLDATTLRPTRPLSRIEDVGGHIPSLPWPLSLVYNQGTGSPVAYYANLQNFFWLPLPGTNETLRIYGMVEQPEFTAASDAFNYPLRVMPPLADFAVRLLKSGTDDDTTDFDNLAGAFFRPVLKGLKKFDRSEPHGRTYTQMHTT